MLKPNVVLPLAASYNERGVAGYTSVVTTGNDQRKINSVYEVARNAGSGASKLYLTKRPGIEDNGTFGTSSHVPYLVGGPAAWPPWVFFTNGTTVVVANNSTSTSIFTDANELYPCYVDNVSISGTTTTVLQTRYSQTASMRVWFASAIGSWTEITDAVFAALIHRGKMEFMDGFPFIMASDGYIYNGSLNTLATWPATSRIAKQSEVDTPAGLARLGNVLLAFGDETVEGFRNAGKATGSPLVRDPSINTKIGMGTLAGWNGGGGGALVVPKRHYYTALGGRLYFVGRSAGGPKIISTDLRQGLYAFDGARFEKVSPQFIDKILSQSVGGVSSINAISCAGQSGVAITLTSPSTETQRALIYFPEWKDWFEWTSPYWQFVSNGAAFIGIAGVSANKLGLFEGSDEWLDGDTSYTMTHQFKLPSDGNHRKTMPMFGVIGDTARSASTLNVEFSDDDGQNWSTARGIDMTSQQKMITRCGGFHGRMVRLTHSGNVECRLEAAVAVIQ